MVIRLDAGPAVSASGLRLLHRLLGPADWLGTEPTGRVRRGRVLPATDYCSRASNDVSFVMESWQQPAAWRAITIATLHHICLMARGPWGRSRPTLGGRLPTGPTCGALAVFWDPAGRWDPPPKGRTDKPSWAQDSVHRC